jgi:nucleotide-binding universal stress UspA family protein
MVKVLLPVDGSKHSLAATRQVIRHAAWHKEPIEVELLTVHGHIPRVAGLSRAVLTAAMVKQHYQDEGEKALGPSRRLLAKAHVRHTEHVLVGDVAPTIVDHATQTGCDMICMGTRGMTAMSGLVMGSVATRVLHLARVPVLLVK